MVVSSKVTAVADSEVKLGQEIYVQVCAACHDSGLEVPSMARGHAAEGWAGRPERGKNQGCC